MSQTLTLEIAKSLVAEATDRLDDDYTDAINASQYSVITEEAAQALAKHDGHLSLDGLTSLTDVAAKALADHNGKVHFEALPEKDEWLYGKYCAERCL